MAPEKSRSLHNFSLPPRLTWGAQRLLRCSKVTPSGTESPTSAAIDGDIQYRRRPRPHRPYDGSFTPSRIRQDPTVPDLKRRSLNSSPDDKDERMESIREKLMIDFQTEVDKIKNAILAEGGDGETDPRLLTHTIHSSEALTVEPRPWNLRTRRAACQEPVTNGGGDEARPRFSSSPVKLQKEISDWDGENAGGSCEEKRERDKFSVSLSRQEIEDDFMELISRRPARKPKKRSKYVQKQLDALFPGLWLTEISADMYKVNENPEPINVKTDDLHLGQ